jgi:hypothetical protein
VILTRFKAVWLAVIFRFVSNGSCTSSVYCLEIMASVGSGKKEKSMESMKNAIIAKLVMVVKTRPQHSKPSIISTKAIGELVDKVEEVVPGWIKKTAHLEKVRTYQSALQQAKNHDIDVKCLTTEEIDKRKVDKTKQKEEKKEKKEEWEELKIVHNQIKSEQIMLKNVNNSSTVMASWKSLRENRQRIFSDSPLCFVVPGHFTKRDGDDDLAGMNWRHDDLILAAQSSHPMVKKVTFFDMTGKGLPERCDEKKEDDEGVKGDALREILLRAVFKYMSPSDTTAVEKDVVAFMKNRVISSSIYDSCQVYGIVKRKEYVEEIVKMRTEEANKLILNQLEYNKCGLFFREVIRPGSNVAKNIKEDSIILWSKDNKSLTELTSICCEAGPGQAFIVYRPGEQAALGVRVMNGKIAQVREKMLKGDNLPNCLSMAVKGRLVYIVDGLPEAYDPRQVITYLGKKQWFVLQGNARNIKSTQLRVLADQEPPVRILPNAATGKHIFIYEEGKKMKEEVSVVVGDGEEDGNNKEKGKDENDEQKGMDWEPPPLFGEDDDDKGYGQQNTAKTLSPDCVNPTVRASCRQNSPLVNSSSSSSREMPKAVLSSSTSVCNAVPTECVKVGHAMTEEDRKRMDQMEDEMRELKNKMASLENNLTKNNEEIGNKFNMLEQQQQASNADIKNMFAQMMSEMSSIKATVTAAHVTPTVPEEQRKKPRVDSTAPMNN